MLRIETSTTTLLGWSTDIFSIDWKDRATRPHTVLVFLPGNPGLVEWYIPMFRDLIQILGPGYCARGVANAGHSLDEGRVDPERSVGSTDVAWTVEGQGLHKAAYMDYLCQEEFPEHMGAKFVIASHSFGSQTTHRLLVHRPDLRDRTELVLYMMPFIRMKMDWMDQTPLDFLSARPRIASGIVSATTQVFRALPSSVVDFMFKSKVEDVTGREVAVKIAKMPAFGRNFITLGLDECTNIPEAIDIYALQHIGEKCPLVMLYASSDRWAPTFHMKDMQSLKDKGLIPSSVTWEYIPELLHGFIIHPHQVTVVVDFCARAIRKYCEGETPRPISRL